MRDGQIKNKPKKEPLKAPLCGVENRTAGTAVAPPFIENQQDAKLSASASSETASPQTALTMQLSGRPSDELTRPEPQPDASTDVSAIVPTTPDARPTLPATPTQRPDDVLTILGTLLITKIFRELFVERKFELLAKVCDMIRRFGFFPFRFFYF